MKYENVFSLLEEITIENSDKVALGIKTNTGWDELTYKELGKLSRRLACHLINDINIDKDERIAILSESKPEYGACVFASVLAGLTSVPLDNKLTIYELTSILSDCEPKILMVSAANIYRAIEIKNNVPSIEHIILLEKAENNYGVISLYELPENYETKWRRRPISATAFIIYTSGTTGAPKGVEISYKNMLAQTQDMRPIVREIIPQRQNIRILSILPINHLFELTVGFFTFLNMGCSIYYAKSLKPKDINDVMREKKITFMLVVPAFLKLVKAAIENELSKKPKFIRNIFSFLCCISKFLPFDMRRKLFPSIHKGFGDEYYGCISGGAPLDIKVGKFFETIGLRVHQGYGLSEASPVVSVNRGKYQNMASVGSPLASLEAKIDKATGELILRGPSIMKGYYKQEELTKQTISEDGWLHTGDIAHMDNHGLIYITGRIKNMIVLSGGKKVFPEEIEALLNQSPNFAEICVLGVSRSGGEKDGTEEIAVVVIPKPEYSENFSDFKTLEDAIVKEIKMLSKNLASYKRPVKIIVRKENLPRTTTNKLKRKEIKEMICS